MEDAHIAIDDLADLSNERNSEPISVFGVFDGHGGLFQINAFIACCVIITMLKIIGKEVAKFCQEKFAAEYIALPEYKEGRYEEALRRAFHRMDELLEDPVRSQIIVMLMEYDI